MASSTVDAVINGVGTAASSAGKIVTGAVGEGANLVAVGPISFLLKTMAADDPAAQSLAESVTDAGKGAVDIGVKVADMGVEGLTSAGTATAKSLLNNETMIG